MAGMSVEALVCSHCGTGFEKSVAQANRQRRALGDRVRFFCTRRCFAASRKSHKSKAQRVAEKAAYDREYRTRDPDALKARKHEYFRRTYDPDKAREHRKEIADWHRQYSAEYRARPEWKEHKIKYDRARRAAVFGELAESHIMLVALEREIRKQPWYERAKERGYYDNNRQTNQRKRNEQVARW